MLVVASVVVLSLVLISIISWLLILSGCCYCYNCCSRSLAIRVAGRARFLVLGTRVVLLLPLIAVFIAVVAANVFVAVDVGASCPLCRIFFDFISRRPFFPF